MRIHVAYVAPDRELLVAIELPSGATVDDAVRASGLTERGVVVGNEAGFAIFGRPATGDTVLRDGDRVEITRALLRDPKAVRRDRAARSGTRADSDRSQGSGGRSSKT